MAYFEQNENAMELRYPEILERWKKQEKDEAHFKVKSIETRDGNSALVVEKEGENYRLNSAYRPLAEAEKWVNQFEFHNIGVNVFMFGFGNGIFVREILRHLEEDGKVFLFEPDFTILSVVFEEQDITDIITDERFHLYVGEEDYERFKTDMDSNTIWHNVPTQISCTHICYDKLYLDEYNRFWDDLKKIDEMTVVKRNTNAHFAHITVENVIQNLKYVKNSNYVSELAGKIPEDIPVIIVSAGPSLDKNIEELHRAKGKAFIIAVDTAVKILETRGVPYDCMVTVDPGKPAWYLTDYPGCAEIPLFCCMESSGEILGFHKGRKIWLPGSVYLENLYAVHGFLFPQNNVGGSVATVAFMLACHLNLKNIILIGQDLAFDGEKTHAGGHENHIADEEDGIQMVDGIDGNPVKTRRDWVMFRDWFEENMKTNPELNVIDATEGGALIHGSKVMTLSEAIDSYCEGKTFCFEDFMKEIPPTFEEHDFEPVRSDIFRMEKGIQNMYRKSVEGKKYAQEFIKAGNKISAKKHDRLIKEIGKVNNFIERQSGYELLDMYTSDLMVGELRDINCMTGDPVLDELNSVKCAEAVYKGMIEASEELKGLLEKSLKEV